MIAPIHPGRRSVSRCILLTLMALACLLPLGAVAAPPPGTVLWEARPGFRDFGDMTEVSGMLITGNITSEGGVIAFSADTGKQIWRVRGGQMRGRPVSDGQHVFVVIYNFSTNRLWCLDLKTGKKLWDVIDDNYDIPAGPLVENGRVYLITKDGKVHAYDALTGKSIWEFTYSPEDTECPTGLALSEGRLYFGGGQHYSRNTQGKFLWAVDAATGKEVWRYKVQLESNRSEGYCITTPAAANGLVVSTAENAVFAVDAQSGALRWKKEVSRLRGGYMTPRQLSGVAISRGKVFAAYGEALASWSLANGAPLREFPGKVGGDPTMATFSELDGVLYFLGEMQSDAPHEGKSPLHAMDVETGNILWTHRVNRPVRFLEDWRTSYVLPTKSGVYYENNSFMAKVSK